MNGTDALRELAQRSLGIGRARGDAPWFFRMARTLTRKRYRGGWRIVNVAGSLGLLDRVVTYSLGGGVTIDVPLSRPSNRWDATDLEDYEKGFVEELARLAARLPRPVHLIDCGADIGLFSLKLAARSPFLAGITAYEPNPIAWRFLDSNLRRLAIPADARKEAAGDFHGRGALQSPAYDPDDHARFVVPVPSGGDTDVARIDDLELPAERSILLKVDTEGTEREVIRGARKTLARAPMFAVGFEAHRAVLRRNRVDPSEIIGLVDSIRPCRAYVAEQPEVVLDPSRRFVDQMDPSWVVCNVICVPR